MASCSADINKDSRWYFTNEQLRNSPSKSSGIDAEKELDHRQQAAHLIQEMGQRLRVYAKKPILLYIYRNILLLQLQFRQHFMKLVEWPNAWRVVAWPVLCVCVLCNMLCIKWINIRMSKMVKVT